jgi:hypothetical protein
MSTRPPAASFATPVSGTVYQEISRAGNSTPGHSFCFAKGMGQILLNVQSNLTRCRQQSTEMVVPHSAGATYASPSILALQVLAKSLEHDAVSHIVKSQH